MKQYRSKIGLVAMSAALLVSAGAAFSAEAPTWKISGGEADAMTDVRSWYATSPSEKNLGMGFPYKNVSSWVGVGCSSSGDSWAFFGFSSSPNLAGDDVHGNVAIRSRWDKMQATSIRAKQKRGERFLHIKDDETFITNVVSRNKLLIELDWFGEDGVYITYSLRGSSKAVKAVFEKCGI